MERYSKMALAPSAPKSNHYDVIKNEDKESYKLSIEKLIEEIRLGKLSKIVFSKKNNFRLF